MNLFEVIRDAKGGITPELVVWALFIGFSIALCFALFSKRYMGNFIHRIIAKKADCPDRAMTLSELGFGKNFFVKQALLGKSAYSGLVFEKDEEVKIEGDSVIPVIRRKVDFENARFYIPRVLIPRAEIRFEKKGTHLMALLVGVLAFFVLSMLVIAYMPEIKEIISDFL